MDHKTKCRFVGLENKVFSMKLKLLVNDKKEWALSLARTLSRFLKSHGFQISNSSADITICIGGDGTIFHFSHLNQIRGAILGIGSKTSSVCQLNHETLKMKRLIDALRVNKTENRLSLVAKFGGRMLKSINDVVIHTHDYRIVTIFLRIGKKKYKFEGDGIILSTPTGSTAYAYSAGGAKLGPNERKISVVPVCPYKRTLKPIVAGEDVEIMVSADRPTDFIIDGIYIGRIAAGEGISVRIGKDVEFLKI